MPDHPPPADSDGSTPALPPSAEPVPPPALPVPAESAVPPDPDAVPIDLSQAHPLTRTSVQQRPTPELTAPRPPQPGFWGALLWTIFYGGVLQVVLAIGLVLVTVVVLAVQSGDPQAYVAKLTQTGFQQSDEAKQLNFLFQKLFLAAFPLTGMAFGYLMIRLTAGRQWKRRLAVRRPGLAHAILTVLGVPAVAVLSDAAYRLAVRGGVPGLGYLEELNKFISELPVGFGVLVIGLGPGVAEELWCRGFLGRGLVARYGYVGGVLLSSFFFALMHVDPPHVVATFVMGICLHFTYLTTRSLWMPMLMHFLNNSLGVFSATLWKDTALGKLIDKPDQTVYPAALILALAVGLALYRSRARLVAAAGAAEPAWRPDFPGVEYPPPESGTRVEHPGPDLPSLVCVAVAVVMFAAALFLSL
jgi:membrane protease YdiL (CAAX protease family)